MATGKSPGLSTLSTNPSQPGKTKEDVPTLKTKVIELERQVNEYKTKLDELRRAKATTVVKLEKEYINTTIPGLNRPEKIKSCEKCDEFEKIIESEKKSNIQLKKILEPQDNNKYEKSLTNSSLCSKCSDLTQLLDIEQQNNTQLTQQFQTQKKQTEQERNTKQILQQTLEIMQSDLIQEKNSYDILRRENQEYQKSFKLIKKEHEDKMIELSHREEEAKKQVDTWEQMYREWMATMERRVNNLQVTNEELETWLHQENNSTKQHKST